MMSSEDLKKHYSENAQVNDYGWRVFRENYLTVGKAMFRVILLQVLLVLAMVPLAKLVSRVMVGSEYWSVVYLELVFRLPLDYFHALPLVGPKGAAEFWLLQLCLSLTWLIASIASFLTLGKMLRKFPEAQWRIAEESLMNQSVFASCFLAAVFFFFVYVEINDWIFHTRRGAFIKNYWGFGAWNGLCCIGAGIASSGLAWLVHAAMEKIKRKRRLID